MCKYVMYYREKEKKCMSVSTGIERLLSTGCLVKRHRSELPASNNSTSERRLGKALHAALELLEAYVKLPVELLAIAKLYDPLLPLVF